MDINKNDEKMIFEKVQEVMIGLAEGTIFNPSCPYCGARGLIFSFTFIPPNKYGLFIFCRSCENHSHMRFCRRPPGFNAQLILPEFQELEEKVENSVKHLLNNNNQEDFER
jgi:hypothetical protein